eukprot:g7012.t1
MLCSILLALVVASAAGSIPPTTTTTLSDAQQLQALMSALGGNASSPLSSAAGSLTSAPAGTGAGYFFRSITPTQPTLLHSSSALGTAGGAPSWLAGHAHYRLLPGTFPKGMTYHFDGLAAVAQFNVTADGSVLFSMQPLQTEAYTNYKKCIFVGSGTGPTLGLDVCFENPAVNLLPIGGELWLTIDTSKWARVDPGTLATLPDKVTLDSMVLNAHPACDRAAGECFVQYPCGAALGGTGVYGDQICFATLAPNASGTGMHTDVRSQAQMPKHKLIQHSHSPCVTPGFVISKLDAFTPRGVGTADKTAGGVLKYARQAEDDLWAVMDRSTNQTTVLDGGVFGLNFVNNHFANCFEQVEPATGDRYAVVDTVAATGTYLDTYYTDNLEKPTNWTDIFYAPQRCRVPLAPASGAVTCSPLLQGADAAFPYFDYPTFNPLVKMQPAAAANATAGRDGGGGAFRSLFAIAPQSAASQWFDSVVKLDASTRRVTQRWSAPGVLFTEADFVPRPGADLSQRDDDGVLLSVLYNTTSDSSSLAVFDAQSLALLDTFELGQALPFHAHGIVCPPGEACYTNP